MKPAIILSGGAEIISVSVAQELIENKVNIAIFSLVKNSVLRGVNYLAYEECVWPPKDHQESIDKLLNFAKKIGATQDNKLPIIATEDGGLRFLYENSSVFNEYLCFGGARALNYGGLDKSELFDNIKDIDISVPTISISKIEDVENAINKFNRNCIIKPALKPLSMNLRGMQSKAIEVSPHNLTSKIISNLKICWSLSDKWVVQPKLDTPVSGEYDVWFVRDTNNSLIALTATEKWKQPKIGGTGCWVVSLGKVEDDLLKKISLLLEKLDFVGAGEIPFLINESGEFKLIEINARPWLQVELAKYSGIPIIYSHYCALIEQEMPKNKKIAENISWVNFERIFMAALSGEYGSRVFALYQAVKATLSADVIAVWSSSLPKVKFYWILKLLSKIKK